MVDRLERIAPWLPWLLVFLLVSIVPVVIAIDEFIRNLGPALLGGPINRVPFSVAIVKVANHAIASLVLPFEDLSFNSICDSVFAAIFLAALLASFASLVLWPVLILLGILLLPFGAEATLTAPFAEISVEPVPEGAWSVHQFLAEPGREPGLFSLAHSAAYDDPRVITRIIVGSENGLADIHEAINQRLG